MRGVCTYDIRSLAVLDVYISGAVAPDSAVEAGPFLREEAD